MCVNAACIPLDSEKTTFRSEFFHSTMGSAVLDQTQVVRFMWKEFFLNEPSHQPKIFNIFFKILRIRNIRYQFYESMVDNWKKNKLLRKANLD